MADDVVLHPDDDGLPPEPLFTPDEADKIREAAETPDKNCFTLPNGDCVGGPCMHDPDSPSR